MRPRDLALLLLASGDLLPRQRARDQQADRAGMALKRRLLDQLATLDPDAEELDATLVRIVDAFGAPTGPTRALALAFREEWQAAEQQPEWVDHLLDDAIKQSGEEPQRGRRDHS